MRKAHYTSLAERLRLGSSGGAHTKESRSGAQNGAETTASLLASGLNARSAELASSTPLQRAAAEGHVDIVSQLLKHGADVTHQDTVHGNSALHEAAWRGYSQTAALLCKFHANVQSANRAGFTPLHLCCQNGHNETCRVLLLAGANPDTKNHYGDTPLHTSARYGHAGVMRILISARCNAAEQNKNGDTALHIAAAMGRRKLTRILLSTGCPALLTLRNKQNETALDIAQRKQHREIIAMLENPPKLNQSRSSRHHKNESRRDSKEREVRQRSKSQSRRQSRESEHGIKREKTDSSSKDSAGSKRKSSSKKHKTKHGEKNCNLWSPYGCHDSPELANVLHSKLYRLPSEALVDGERFYLDLAGNVRKGPVGIVPCYCGPLLHRLECRLERDKLDILGRLDSTHHRLDSRISALEQRTQVHLEGLQRTVDSLNLESTQAGLQRVRDSIVTGANLRPSHMELTSPAGLQPAAVVPNSPADVYAVPTHHKSAPLQEENHYLDMQSTKATVDRLGLETGPSLSRLSALVDDQAVIDGTLQTNDSTKSAAAAPEGQSINDDDIPYSARDNRSQAMQTLKARLALAEMRSQQQQELDAIIAHYENRTAHHHRLTADTQYNNQHPNDHDSDTQSEDLNPDDLQEIEETLQELIPPPIHYNGLDQGRSEANVPQGSSDHRSEASHSALSHANDSSELIFNREQNPNAALTSRDLPFNNHHFPGGGAVFQTTKEGKMVDVSGYAFGYDPYVRNYPYDPDFERDRHNDSGYSTRVCGSSHGTSPALSGATDMLDPDHFLEKTTATTVFQSHFARDLARTLPILPLHSATASTHHHLPYLTEEELFPPGTISASSLV